MIKAPGIMQHISSPNSAKLKANAIISKAFGVRLVSDVPERLARLHVHPWLNAKRKARIKTIRERELLFVHIPKNAGTSICQRLYGCQVKHASVSYYAKAAPDILALPSFAVIRNPMERFFSAFHYAQSGGTKDQQIALPFQEQYRAFKNIDDAINHLASARSVFDIDHVFRPQSWYLYDSTGHCPIDIFIPYHRVSEIGIMLGIRDLAYLPRLNCNDSTIEPLDGAQLAFLQSFYQDDFRLFAQHIY